MNRPLTFDDVVRPFAEAIFIKVGLIRSDKLDKRNVAHVLDSINKDLRKCSDILISTVRPPEVSEAANARAQDMGVDLRVQPWAAQRKFDPGRATFVLEHVIPVVTLVQASLVAESTEALLAFLRENMRVAWILRAEDQRLNELGFRKVRPDPSGAYEAAGIRLLPA